jgi:glycosyltransferase involved in cell wall biosynthesis
MKIALVIPGRFHGFDLAAALIARGHDVTVLTNYPAWAVRRFGLPVGAARCYVLHGVISRLAGRLPRAVARRAEAFLHRMFGRWAAGVLRRDEWDVIHCWSGVAEELLASTDVRRRATLLMRGSAHIAVQDRLLREEEQRARVRVDRPSAWMIAREQREYAMADRILVLSTFARDSFREEGTPSDRLVVVPLGVTVDAFRPPIEVIERRQARIRAGEPLRVLYVGAVSFQKGILDLADAIDRMRDRNVRFTIVGPVLPEAEDIVRRLRDEAAVVGKLPEHALPEQYWRADVFVFPTIQDGYAIVLAQARAAALPIVTTRNSAGADLIEDGRDGWLVPIRDSATLAARLIAAESDRPRLADMVGCIYDSFHAEDWARVAERFERACVEHPVAEAAPVKVTHG